MGKRNSKKESAVRRCALCGKVVFAFEQGYVTGATGRVVCPDCLDTSKKLLSADRQKAAEKDADKILTPQAIVQELDKSIIGQERAKRAIAIALWKQQLRAAGDQTVPRSNILLYGPTGCGKSALVREAARITGLPFISFDATTLSETGYRGRDAVDLVKDLMEQFRDHPKLPYGIVFLDEFDKLAARGGKSRAEYSRGTQHALLKLVEGVAVHHETAMLSTDTLLFIFGGAFTGLNDCLISAAPINPVGFMRRPSPVNSAAPFKISTETFVSYGMEPELMGRVGQYVALEPLGAAELKRILRESRLSPYLQYKRFFAAHGVTLEFSEKRVNALVEAAIARGTGVRGLNSLIEEAVEPLLFRLASSGLSRPQGTMKEVV